MSPAENMGQVFADFILHGPDGQQPMRLLVDTGSTLTWIRGEVLERLGIVKVRERSFQPITGPPIRRWIGLASVEFEGERAATNIAFALPTDAEVFGLTTVEELGLEVDPIRHRLKESDTLLALHASAADAAPTDLD